MTVLQTKPAIFLVSIILGIGLASLFRQVCKTGKCLLIKGPSLHDVEKKMYKIDERCYTYTPSASLCPIL